MVVEINFRRESFPEAELTVRQTLERLGWSFPLVIVRIGGKLVERSAWDETLIRDGDVVDMYHLVSGG